MNDRLIFHVDVNSAFLSWEAVERIANGETLDLRTIPSCVGGDPDRRTSIVSTKSIPAKKYGIVTGEPVATALRKCPELIVVKPNFQLYKKMSYAFKSILNEYTPLMQSFSIDEVFMDMSGMERLYPLNDEKNNALYARYRELADREENVIFGGRLGDYRYYNMDEVVLQSMELARRELGRKVLGLGRMRWQADV